MVEEQLAKIIDRYEEGVSPKSNEKNQASQNAFKATFTRQESTLKEGGGVVFNLFATHKVCGSEVPLVHPQTTKILTRQESNFFNTVPEAH